MRIWTTHEKPHAQPLLVREGFSMGAFLFGPVWLAMHRAFLPAAIALSLFVLVLGLAPPPAAGILAAGLAVLTGQCGYDLVRWSAAQAGYVETGVVAARDGAEALTRFLSARPDQVAIMMRAEAP